MRSKWISHQGRQIFWQDFSNNGLLGIDAVILELQAVQEIVLQQPENSVLVLADFRDTQIGKELLDLMIASSSVTKAHVKKTAVLGIVGAKRILADVFVQMTGHELSIFDNIEAAKDWLVTD